MFGLLWSYWIKSWIRGYYDWGALKGSYLRYSHTSTLCCPGKPHASSCQTLSCLCSRARPALVAPPSCKSGILYLIWLTRTELVEQLVSALILIFSSSELHVVHTVRACCAWRGLHLFYLNYRTAVTIHLNKALKRGQKNHIGQLSWM